MVNIATSSVGDSMASYTNLFLRQGTDHLMIALRSMSRYVPLAGKAYIFFKKSFNVIDSNKNTTDSLIRDLDLESRRMAPIFTTPRYSKELHVISDLEHRHNCAVVR